MRHINPARDLHEDLKLPRMHIPVDEKRIMHMSNSFVRKQRVVADGHVPWTCEAFSKHHAQELVDNPDLRWCWRLLMMELWKHGLAWITATFFSTTSKKSTGPKKA